MHQDWSTINGDIKFLFFLPKGTLSTPERYQCTFNIDQGDNMSLLIYHATRFQLNCRRYTIFSFFPPKGILNTPEKPVYISYCPGGQYKFFMNHATRLNLK